MEKSFQPDQARYSCDIPVWTLQYRLDLSAEIAVAPQDIDRLLIEAHPRNDPVAITEGYAVRG